MVSLGTGLEDAIQLTTESKAPSTTGATQQLSPKQAFEAAVANYCTSCVTSCERTHVQVASNLSKFGINDPWQYVRLNVPQGMAKIGLHEWKNISMIAALTDDYMEDIDVREIKTQVAERLRSPAGYAISSGSTSVPAKGPAENRRYAVAQRQIVAQGGPAT